MTSPPPHDSGSKAPPDHPGKVDPDDAATEHAKTEEIVLTPGGYRPKSHVHRVGPDVAVHVNEDGSHSVVPKEEP